MNNILYFFRIRIRGSGFEHSDPDPDPTIDIPNQVGENKICMQFLTWFKHLVTLKIKYTKIILPELYFTQCYIPRTGVCLWTKNPDPNDPKWPDPDPQHWLQLYTELLFCVWAGFYFNYMGMFLVLDLLFLIRFLILFASNQAIIFHFWFNKLFS